jgi:hypothetical protein
MTRFALAFAAAVQLLLAAATARAADFQRDCVQWIDKHGYSADYIKLKTGKRQSGTPDGWRGNIAARDVRAGDVVITAIKDKYPHLRVSFVEEVRPNGDGSAGAAVVTEWNEGKYVDEPCFVTDHFGRDSGRRAIPIDSVVRAWRPSLPLSGVAPE